MQFVAVPAGLLTSSVVMALGDLAAEATGTGGLDLLGVAAVITAVSGLIATVGALVLGLRRKDAQTDALAKVLQQLADKQKGES